MSFIIKDKLYLWLVTLDTILLIQILFNSIFLNYQKDRACFVYFPKHALKISYPTIFISSSIPNSLSIIICITIWNGMFPLRLRLSWIKIIYHWRIA
ncbi:hypothetical protein COJ30_13335 [Bacillus anthracis]|uniref:Uncharacterized protein n=1 Tax=Bacillus anthracis TaxID=1392 RepID=A0A2B0XX48_BACAN|nr:hypothetical protein COJ30_13335 [Bacillus anthracis]